LATILNLTLQFQSLEDIWNLCERSWSPQCKVTILSAILNIMTAIWSARNNARFNNKLTHWKSAISWISSNITLAGNNTRSCSTGSIRDFTVLKNFNVIIHPPKAPVIKEIVWQPPIANWVKCNTDGASNLVTSSCGGIFRNSDADFLCCFAENISLGSAFSAELAWALRANEIDGSIVLFLLEI
jgi:hypothetical protein